MKRQCSFCNGELYFILKKNNANNDYKHHLFCKECGKHNQFCNSKHAYLYEDRTQNQEQNTLL